MDEDDETIDIEGDYDCNIGYADSEPLLYDVDEPPSKSVKLIPELSQHPWMLEQGWSLDHCADEKSKAAIERMLLEEQNYLQGKREVSTVKESLPQEATSSPKKVSKDKKAIQIKKTWTEEEKQAFEEGFKTYGNSWSKISCLIPTRTKLQVKNYGHKYLKSLEKQEGTTVSEDGVIVEGKNIAKSVEEILRSVTTAQTTIQSSSTYVFNSNPSPQNQIMAVGVYPKHSSMIKKNTKSAPLFNKAAKEAKLKKSQSASQILSKLKQNDTKAAIGKIPHESNCLKRGPVIISDSKELIHLKKGDSDEGSDIDVDIDIDSEDDVQPKAQNTECVKDDLIYKKLLESARKEESQDESGESENESHTGGDLNHDEVEEVLVTDKEKNCHSVEDIAFKQEECSEFLDNKSKVDIDCCSQELSNESGDKGDIHRDWKTSFCENKSFGDINVTFKVESEINHSEICGDKIKQEKSTSSDEEEEDEEEEHNDEYGILTSGGEIVYLPNPKEEKTLVEKMVCDQEKNIHAEFFDGRPGLKNEERYLKIRNVIINAWKKSTPDYLYKTAVRPGLKNCGDVNCIGRIHAYLEQIGAINFGCAQSQYNRPRRGAAAMKMRISERSCDDPGVMKAVRMESMRPRNRRVRDHFGEWVNEKDLEGQTIEHKVKSEHVKRLRKRPRITYQQDPFKLITCENFTQTKPAPFTVEIESSSNVIIDIHAHLSKTEVIGLLGGKFNKEMRMLTISTAEPCESHSTGMQCEMDPVSQTEASERILAQGLQVVGWYHSHPTFAPNPSIRDIETQENFQNWFALGGAPFVGVIVSPYNFRETASIYSDVKCLVVDHEKYLPDTHLGTPYHFMMKQVQTTWDDKHMVEKVNNLAQTYCLYKNRVEMLHHFKTNTGFSCLDKMLQSIDRYLPDVQESEKDFKKMLESIFMDFYKLDYQQNQHS